MEHLAKFITSDLGVTIACSVIVVWALTAYLRFRSHLIPSYKELQDICSFLLENINGETDLASRIEELDKKVCATQLMKHKWREFRETLIYPNIDDQEQVLYNSQNANSFFSLDGLLGERVNIRLYNALPNLLTGAGILGTFIGLVAGISLAGESLTDPLKAQTALVGHLTIR